MKSATPFSRSYWVQEGKLLAGYYPGESDLKEARKKLGGLLDSGIRAIVNLMEVDERGHNDKLFVHYDDEFTRLASEMGLAVRCVRWPIPDMTAPSPETMKRILDEIDMFISSGTPVYVHCRGGLGRTGSVVGCWLARHGVASGKDVVEHIRRLRVRDGAAHMSSPQTHDQFALIESWRVGE